MSLAGTAFLLVNVTVLVGIAGFVVWVRAGQRGLPRGARFWLLLGGIWLAALAGALLLVAVPSWFQLPLLIVDAIGVGVFVLLTALGARRTSPAATPFLVFAVASIAMAVLIAILELLRR